MKIWFDTEFIDDGKTIELISIGMLREDGATYYAESAECDRSRFDQWLTENVAPHLRGPVKSRREIADDIYYFVGRQPQFWAYCAAYDWVALCQLYGKMIDLPHGWPKFCRDLKQLCLDKGNPKLIENARSEHDALSDALWNGEVYEFLMTRSA